MLESRVIVRPTIPATPTVAGAVARAACGSNPCFVYCAAAIALFIASSASANRQLESLERYPSASLSLFSISAVGCDGTRTAGVLDADGDVHDVRPGNYLGDAYGKIVEITDREVRFIELHQSKNGDWAEVPKTLRLRDGLSAKPAAQPVEAEPQESDCDCEGGEQ